MRPGSPCHGRLHDLKSARDSTDVAVPPTGRRGHALEAIAHGRAKVALITLAGRPRSEGQATAPHPAPAARRSRRCSSNIRTSATANMYACAPRGTCMNTAPERATRLIRSPHRIMRNTIRTRCCVTWTVEDVVNSPMVASPLHGWMLLTATAARAGADHPEVAKSLSGAGESDRVVKREAPDGSAVDLVYSAAAGRSQRGRCRASRRPTSVRGSTTASHHRVDAVGRPGVLRERPRRKFVSDGNLISASQAAVQHDGAAVFQPPGNAAASPRSSSGAAVARRGASEVQVKNCTWR